MAGKIGEFHFGEERRESAQEKAERIVAEEMRKLGWGEQALREHRKGDLGKVKIARCLRRETTVTLKWIAARLQIGVWTHVTNRLYHTAKRIKNVNTKN